MTHLLGVPAEPRRGNRSLRWAVGLDSPLHRSWDLFLEAMQGMINTMNAIANQVIRNSGRATRAGCILTLRTGITLPSRGSLPLSGPTTT
jgi:hypothetical protein